MLAVLILLGRHGQCTRNVVKERDLIYLFRTQIAGVIRVDIYEKHNLYFYNIIRRTWNILHYIDMGKVRQKVIRSF